MDASTHPGMEAYRFRWQVRQEVGEEAELPPAAASIKEDQ
jgi:hypothetical protein